MNYTGTSSSRKFFAILLFLSFSAYSCATLPLQVNAPLEIIEDTAARAQCISCVQALNAHRAKAEQQSVANSALVIAGGSVSAIGGVLGIAFEGAEVDRRATITAAIIAATSGLVTLISTLISDPSASLDLWRIANDHYRNGWKFALSKDYEEAARAFLSCHSDSEEAEFVWTN